MIIFGDDLSNFFQSGNRCKTIHSHNKLSGCAIIVISLLAIVKAKYIGYSRPMESSCFVVKS